MSGNLKPAWKRMVKTGISSKDFRQALVDESFWQGGSHGTGYKMRLRRQKKMKTYLCTGNAIFYSWVAKDLLGTGGGFDEAIKWKPYILESFYYADEDTERLVPYFGDFLLDSGAFTFMQNSHIKADWNEYVERYADFINRNKINKFFELDIDSVVGYEEVKNLRFKLEKLTGKQVIPVWHKSRGYGEFEALCAEYPYVAIGGIVSKEISKDQYKAFPAMIKKAHTMGTKIHGLGFTNLALLPKMHFDSVDSTAWTTGNRFGFVYHFDGKTMKKIDAPEGMRLKDGRRIALINYTEWIKFQKYAERCL